MKILTRETMRMGGQKWVRRKWVGVLAVMLAGAGVGVPMSTVANVSAANLAAFRAGYIISDYQMMNYGAMSEAEIQAFLSAKNSCGNRDYNYYLRLSGNRNYSWHWTNGHFVCLSEERFGDGETIGVGETAAHIIWQAAQDYRINPQVLIVMLQKESSLITDPIPNNGDYRKAMGYGCPDTAACSSKYYGFRNQVRNAAALFRSVMDGGWTNYPVGNNYIRYNPNAVCGGSVVNVQNRATSALYRYTPYQPNAAVLTGGGDGCSAYGNKNFYSYFEDWFGNITGEGRASVQEVLTRNRIGGVGTDLGLNYQAHVANYGWLPETGDGEMAGTAGYGLRMEGLRLSLKNETGIEYRAHVSNVGWMGYVRDGALAGTTGRGLQMEAVQIRLTGDMAKLYDVYYRTHVSNVGWTGWSKNNEVSGTTGRGLQMEAVQIKIVKKSSGVGPEYQAHVSNVGWMNWAKAGAVAGTTGRGLKMEGLRVKMPAGVGGEISYRAHVATIGWQGWVKNGGLAGTTGRALQMEAVQLKLEGNAAKQYDIYYRTHVQDVGWMKWVKNGEVAGTTGRGLRMEAVQVELVRK